MQKGEAREPLLFAFGKDCGEKAEKREEEETTAKALF
jgi:hypothetical protein